MMGCSNLLDELPTDEHPLRSTAVSAISTIVFTPNGQPDSSTMTHVGSTQYAGSTLSSSYWQYIATATSTVVTNLSPTIGFAMVTVKLVTWGLYNLQPPSIQIFFSSSFILCSNKEMFIHDNMAAFQLLWVLWLLILYKLEFLLLCFLNF